MRFLKFTEKMHGQFAEASMAAGIEYLKQHTTGVTSVLRLDDDDWIGRIEIEGRPDLISVTSGHWEDDPSIAIHYVVNDVKNKSALSVTIIADDGDSIEASVCEYDFEITDQTMVGAVRAVALAALQYLEKAADDPQADAAIGRIRKTIHLL